MGRNVFYAQSGGVTAVINASACGVIQAVRERADQYGHVFAGHNGILGALHEELIDTHEMSLQAIQALRHTPGGAFGSCRYKLKGLDENKAQYERLIAVFEAHDIGTFFYNGGGDSQDTAHKVSQLGAALGYPIQCIGIPKTVDNDLPFTDTCPGFGSVAKYVAISTMEAAYDVASMSRTSTKVFILEVMGRHAGWIAAAAGVARKELTDAPHIILFPERAFNKEAFLAEVDKTVTACGYCVVVASEGAKYADGRFLSEMGQKDAFGHQQLGGVAPVLANMVQQGLGLKYHWAVADYLQRAARHIASKTDVEQAYAVGRHAVELAQAGRNAVMPIIVRKQAEPYQWGVDAVPLSEVANVERLLPDDYMDDTGFGITEKAKQYLLPLIQGEDYPPYQQGLPVYQKLPKAFVDKKLPPFDPGAC